MASSLVELPGPSQDRVAELPDQQTPSLSAADHRGEVGLSTTPFRPVLPAGSAMVLSRPPLVGSRRERAMLRMALVWAGRPPGE